MLWRTNERSMPEMRSNLSAFLIIIQSSLNYSTSLHALPCLLHTTYLSEALRRFLHESGSLTLSTLLASLIVCSNPEAPRMKSRKDILCLMFAYGSTLLLSAVTESYLATTNVINGFVALTHTSIVIVTTLYKCIDPVAYVSRFCSELIHQPQVTSDPATRVQLVPYYLLAFGHVGLYTELLLIN